MITPQQVDIIDQTKEYVQQTLHNAEGGHDWWHILRVYNNTQLIGQSEPADPYIIRLAALLHDIADPKFHNGDEEIGPQTATAYLHSLQVDHDVIHHVVQIIKNMSYKNSLEGTVRFNSIELQVVQDADRLDAIGAIGIARAFNYGGYKNRALYDPTIPPNLHMTKDEYKKSTAPTINHFYEKLLLLKDKMNTTTAKNIAAQRHHYMEQYLSQFYGEWNGER